MPSLLCITVRFLQPLSHGRGDAGEPEWPPSPLRLFQALVAAAAARWNERVRIEYAAPALRWFAGQGPPTIVAAPGAPAADPYRLYVPDNVGDRVARSWRSGNADASVAEYRTEKDVRPTHLAGEAVHYVYTITEPAEFTKHRDALVAAARSITHLGWGVDMVVGNASEITVEDSEQLAADRWQPTKDNSGTRLRVPRRDDANPHRDTFQALAEKHTAFLNRISGDNFNPVPPLTAFDVIGYRRETEPAGRPWVAFSILTPDASGNRAFDTARRCRDVAAWVRHATAAVCEGWPFGSTAGFVHGHTDDGRQLRGERADERFMYLPLPTINSALGRVESIRRVLVAAPPGFSDRTDWIRRRLPGQELVWDGNPVGLLNLLPTSDWVLRQYTGESTTWSTVTPVIWPGYDDRNPAKAERLLRKAFVDAGLAPKLVEGIAELDWRPVGFRAGAELASRFAVPEQLNGPRYHVRVRFSHPIRGPLAVGSGRYRGMGLFAVEPD